MAVLQSIGVPLAKPCLRPRFRLNNNAASSKLDDDNRSPLRLRYACLTRQGQPCASRNAFSPKNSQGSAQMDAPIGRLPSGRGYAANCGLACQPFRVHLCAAPPVTRGRTCHCLAATTLLGAKQYDGLPRPQMVEMGRDIASAPRTPTQATLLHYGVSRRIRCANPSLLSPARPLAGTGYHTGSHSGSRVSSGLPLLAHVASRCYSADLFVVCPRLPPGHSFA